MDSVESVVAGGTVSPSGVGPPLSREVGARSDGEPRRGFGVDSMTFEISNIFG